MINEIIVATGNTHKLKEFESIFGNGIKFFSLIDVCFTGEIIEDGSSFIENSIIKCNSIYKIYKKPVLADDSGLSVAQLNGEPGIYSARFGGSELNDRDRYELLLTKLDKTKDLSASFVCALTLYINPNKIYIIQEEIAGKITFTPRGTNGFGYDPIFYLKEFDKTMAELTEQEKNLISHRGKAGKKIIGLLRDIK